MKRIIKNLLLWAVAPVAALALNSCGLDEPFADGQGSLRIKMVIDSEVTRAETDVTDLGATCKLYISQGDNLIYKFTGLDEIPSMIPFRSGHYLAEAYAGTKTPASFTDKYYEGTQEFDITDASVTNMVMTCKIANVVASVNSSTIHPEHLMNYKITVGHSGGTLDFTESNVATEDKAYFCMPDDETALAYTVEGDNAEGKHFVTSGTIPDVQKAHEYRLNIKCSPDAVAEGGAYITVEIDDSEILVEDEIVMTAAPEISGIGFNIANQQYIPKGSFSDMYLRIRAFSDLTALRISGVQAFAPSSEYENDINFIAAQDFVISALADNGISYRTETNASTGVVRSIVTLSADMLNALAASNTEYVLEITAVDSAGKQSVAKFRLANTEAAVILEDPVVVNRIDQAADLMAVGAKSATITGVIVNPDVVNPAVRFRVSGTEEWQSVSISSVAAKARRTRADETSFSVKLSGLLPATRYEYQAYADGMNPSESYFFTTEGTFTIPNASLESWSTYSAKTMLGTKTVIFPGEGSEPTFWDSGNEGAATANKTLTDKSTDMVHSGTYSCRLASSSAANVMAAGNLFVGDYVKTDGTNGVLQFGREYNGSHPSKLALYANYRPGNVDIIKDLPSEFASILVKDQPDYGQIYVALTTAPIDIRTKASDRKLFNPDDAEVIAYGQVTWHENFSASGLSRLEIPLEYKASAKTSKPLYLVIVCSASKYGDYFSGSSSSVMYVDDFELIYE